MNWWVTKLMYSCSPADLFFTPPIMSFFMSPLCPIQICLYWLDDHCILYIHDFADFIQVFAGSDSRQLCHNIEFDDCADSSPGSIQHNRFDDQAESGICQATKFGRCDLLDNKPWAIHVHHFERRGTSVALWGVKPALRRRGCSRLCCISCRLVFTKPKTFMALLLCRFHTQCFHICMLSLK